MLPLLGSLQALEPAFSVGLSALILGERPHPLVLCTLVPIMGGVAMASVSEVSGGTWRNLSVGGNANGCLPWHPWVRSLSTHDAARALGAVHVVRGWGLC